MTKDKLREQFDKIVNRVSVMEEEGGTYEDMCSVYERAFDRMEDVAGKALKQRDDLHLVLSDMLSGWKYIRQTHGDLPGVGWDRCQEAAEKALAPEGLNATK